MIRSANMSAKIQKELDSPIRSAIRDSNYQRYMRLAGTIAVSDRAYEKVRDIFKSNETPRSVWNNLILQKPHFCGKSHESPLGIAFIECAHHDNPLCGHPEETQFFHGLGVVTYLASKLDKTIKHPRIILERGLSRLDRVAEERYRTDFGVISPLISPENIRQTKKYMIEEEKRLWGEVIHPHMMRVSEILRAA